MDENEKEELEEEIINLKGEVATLRVFTKTLSVITISIFSKTYGVSIDKAREFFEEILSDRLSEETNSLLDSTSLDDEIRSLFEDD